jgi:hypothetical protein
MRGSRMKAERCAAIAKSGKPCSSTPAPGLTYCAWHAPEWVERRRQWSAKGGQQRSNQSRAKKQFADGDLSPQEISGLLGQALRDVLSGKVEAGPANASANIARAIVAVREATTVEGRLSELETRAGLNVGGRTA